MGVACTELPWATTAPTPPNTPVTNVSKFHYTSNIYNISSYQLCSQLTNYAPGYQLCSWLSIMLKIMLA